jgi:hypothetical protein
LTPYFEGYIDRFFHDRRLFVVPLLHLDEFVVEIFFQ